MLISAKPYFSRRGAPFLVIAVLVTCGHGLAQNVSPSLQITSPADGAVVSPGQTVTVSVASSGDNAGVMVIPENPLDVGGGPEAPPAVFSVMVPSDISLRRYVVRALSLNRKVQPASITLDVERPDMPRLLSEQVRSLRFQNLGESFPLTPIATFSDGHSLEVTESSRIAYFSSDISVVKVNSNGLTTSVAPGKAVVTVVYKNPGGSDLKLLMPVKVELHSVDFEPYSLDFGTVTVGSKARRIVTVKNVSLADNELRIREVKVTGSYSESNTCVGSAPLPVGSSCVIDVTFEPESSGAHPGTLSITNSGTGTSRLALTGAGRPE